VLKQIVVAELQPDETVDAVREARLLAKVILNPHTRTKAVWVVIVLQTGSVTLFAEWNWCVYTSPTVGNLAIT